MHIYFILVEPVLAENVGAAARALKTMGFQHLRIVNSERHLEDKARWVAHGSREILLHAESYTSLANATADLDLIIGTTAKKRHQRNYAHSPKELAPLISNKPSDSRIGIVFGREDQGLSNEEVASCDLMTSIPLAASYPSLNLGQAVMLYAYELNQLSLPESSDGKTPELQLKALKHKLRTLLADIGIANDAKEHRWVEERIGVLAERDIGFMHTLINSVQRTLHAPPAAIQKPIQFDNDAPADS